MNASFLSNCRAFVKLRQHRCSSARAVQVRNGEPNVSTYPKLAGVRQTLSKLTLLLSGLANPGFLAAASSIAIYLLLCLDGQMTAREDLRTGISPSVSRHPRRQALGTDDALLELRQPERLTFLCLRGANVSDRGMKVLHKAPRVVMLELNHTFVTGAALRVIGGLRELEALHLRYLRVCDDDLVHLNGSPIKVLDLTGTFVTDAGLQHLMAVPELQHLFLDDTAITDRGLATVQKMPSLASLRVRGTGVTEEGVRALKAARSDLTIGWRYGAARSSRSPN